MGRLVFAAALAAALAACAADPASSPRSAVDAYGSALEDGRSNDAYALLSSETQKDLSFAEFERLLRENPEEVKALVRSLRSPTEPAYVTARVSTPTGKGVQLVYEDGAWRVDASAIDLYGQNTPRQALESFLRAYDNQRYDVLLRFVPDAEREGLDAPTLREAWEGEQKAEIDRVVAGLRQSVATGSIELLGDRATMSYGAGGSVELVLEHGAWKIEDFR